MCETSDKQTLLRDLVPRHLTDHLYLMSVRRVTQSMCPSAASNCVMVTDVHQHLRQPWFAYALQSEAKRREVTRSRDQACLYVACLSTATTVWPGTDTSEHRTLHSDTSTAPMRASSQYHDWRGSDTFSALNLALFTTFEPQLCPHTNVYA